MAMRTPFLLLVLFSCLMPFLSLKAQRTLPDVLKTRIENSQDVRKVINEIEAYYNGGENLSALDFKTYKNLMRMAYWAEKRLLPNGVPGDFNTQNRLAMQAVEAEFGVPLQQAKSNWQSYQQAHDGEQNQIEQLAQDAEQIEAMSAFGAWTNIGPFNGGVWSNSGEVNADLNGVGRADRIAFHPTNSNIVFIGTPSGGLWRLTLNAAQTGATWTCISDNLPAQGIAGVAVHPTNGNIIYVLTGDGDSNIPGFLVFNNGFSASSQGVFKTVDGGANWVRMAPFPDAGEAYSGHKLTISYTNGNYLFACTSAGLYRTTNGANSWERVRTGVHRDVEFRPGSDSIIYASTNNSVHYSNAGGRLNTWSNSNFSHSIAAGGRVELAVRRTSNNANSTVVYALVGPRVTDSTFRGIFRSGNNGVDFTRQTNSPNILTFSMDGKGTSDQSNYDLCIAVSPTSVNTIVTGGIITWRSTNGGVTMTNSSLDREGSGAANRYVHPDIHDLAYSPYNNLLFNANDGGVNISSDNGQTWLDISNGKATTQFYHFKMHDPDGNGYANDLRMIAGAQDNGVKYRNAAGTFRHTTCCDGFDGVISGKNPDNIFYNFNARFYRSTNAGVNIGYLFDVAFFSPVAVDWNNPDTMYVGTTQLVRTFNAFSTRTNINTGGFRRVLSTSPSNSSRIYGSGGTTLVVSDDRGTTQTSLHTMQGYPAGSPTVTDIKPMPTNSNEIYITYGGYTAGLKVLRVTNPFAATPTFTNISANLPNVAIFSVCPTAEGIYVGTDIGVFIRPAGQASWYPFFNGLPPVPVTDIWANENGNVYASTFGRGIWFSARKSACVNGLTLSNSIKGSYFYQAANTIVSTQQTDNSEGTILNLKANSFIELRTGFWARQGSFFKTTLSPCDQGANNLIFSGFDAEKGQEVIYPIGLEELHIKKHPPLTGAAYMQSDSAGVCFYLPQSGMLEILGMAEGDGEWKILKPAFESSAGHYKIHFNNILPEQLAIRVNGRLLKKID